MSIFDDGVPNEGLTQGINRKEVKVAISRMKNGNATGMDGIPIKVWKCLGEDGIDMLWDLMQEIWASVTLGDTLGMLSWRETINVMLCCFGGKTDK